MSVTPVSSKAMTIENSTENPVMMAFVGICSFRINETGHA